MDISLNLSHQDINEAIASYVASKGVQFNAEDMKITFTAGRGSNGKNSASIAIAASDLRPGASKVGEAAAQDKAPDKKEKVKAEVQEDLNLESTTKVDTESELDDVANQKIDTLGDDAQADDLDTTGPTAGEEVDMTLANDAESADVEIEDSASIFD